MSHDELSDEGRAWLSDAPPSQIKQMLGGILLRFGRDALRDTFFEILAEGADAADEVTLPQLIQVSNFLKNLGDPRPMMVDRLIPDQSLLLLSGKPKYGKSLLALDVAEAICRGGKLWGEFQINKSGPVVYFGMEDGDIEIGNRLLTRGLRMTDTELPFYICHNHLRLSDPSGVALLRLLCEPIRPVLVTIDTARESLGVQDWNNPAELTEKLRPIRQFARDVCTVILVAHNRKAGGEDAVDEIGGSNSFASSVDGWFSARRKEDMPGGNRRLYINVDGRGGMRGEVCVEMDTTNTHFSYISDELLADERKEQQQEKQFQKHRGIVDALVSLPNGTGTVTQIAAKMGLEYDNARIQVSAAEKDGAIEQVGTVSSGGRGRPSPIYKPAGNYRNTENTYRDNFGNSVNQPRENSTETRLPYADNDDDRGEF